MVTVSPSGPPGLFKGVTTLTELIPVAVNPGNNCLPLPKVITYTVDQPATEL